MIQKILSSLLLFSFLFFLSCTSEQSNQPPEENLQIDLPSDGIEIENVWARPGREGGTTAIYMTILNGSSETDTLISLSSPVSGMAEIHETYEEEGMMGMRSAETVIVPARGILSLEPGGLHVMLMQLNRALAEGDSIEFTAEFVHGGQITQIAHVKPMQ